MSRHLQRGRGPERGSVTAELAVALPALVLLLGVILGAATVGVTQLRLEEAARAGAREIARGEAGESVEATVRRLAGPGAGLEVAGDGDWTSVTVTTRVQGPFLDLLKVRLSATASGWSEHAR
ncbi:pilus assembly protein TadE [Arthrobacter crusticola]|uniref:Pilus assembly protein TadE n=1 Tax=Arthrobacter crusticola TaxID=2547960 RepID=A0A4R5TWJ6_9MICC|nr:TadE family type IV pilus minor pilin [Arthrobacter crusticola]TDK25468.1 pilus assembly protein TadE [Arthrobacter crusticola]